MFRHRKHTCVAWALLATVSMAAALLLAGCGGQMVFADTTALTITATPPPPPPPPEPPPPPPPPKPKRVVVTADKIEIKEKIQFDVNKATIKAESHGLLNEIVSVIKENAHIRKISIEGHTDSDGTDKYNQKLSDNRAAAVKQYLVEKGIAEGMLESKGWGESKPMASNDTDEGKEKNRRVEFLIKAQDEVKKVFEVDPKTGKKREVKQEAKKPKEEAKKPEEEAKK